MLQTLFFIPDRIFGIPLFGPSGALFVIWALAALAVLGRHVYQQGFTSELLGLMGLLAFVGAVILFFLPNLLEPREPAPSEALGLPIRGYGVMVLIGVVSGVALAVQRAKRRGVEPELIFSLALWLFVGGMLGARAFYVMEYWDRQFYHTDPAGHFDFIGTLKAVLNIAQGGLVIYGALIGGAVSSVIFLRMNRLPLLKIADIAAPSMALGLGIGRIGCFLNGCCFGGVCDLPWAVAFPENSPPYKRQIETGQLYLHGLAFNGKSEDKRVVIASVEKGSLAEKAGMQAGDQIIEISERGKGEFRTQRLFSIVESREGESSAASLQDDTLGGAVRALLSIRGAGTKIIVETAERNQPVEWTLAEAIDLPTRSLPVHPTQLYSAIDAILLVLLLLAYDPFRRHDGEVFALMVTVHPIAQILARSDSHRRAENLPALWNEHLAIVERRHVDLRDRHVDIYFPAPTATDRSDAARGFALIDRRTRAHRPIDNRPPGMNAILTRTGNRRWERNFMRIVTWSLFALQLSYGALALAPCVLAAEVSATSAESAPATSHRMPPATPAGEKTGLIPREVLFGNPDKAAARMSHDGKWLSFFSAGRWRAQHLGRSDR